MHRSLCPCLDVLHAVVLALDRRMGESSHVGAAAFYPPPPTSLPPSRPPAHPPTLWPRWSSYMGRPCRSPGFRSNSSWWGWGEDQGARGSGRREGGGGGGGLRNVRGRRQPRARRHSTLHKTPRDWSRSFLGTISHIIDATCRPTAARDGPPLFELPGRCSVALLMAWIMFLLAIECVVGRAPGNRGSCRPTELALRARARTAPHRPLRPPKPGIVNGSLIGVVGMKLRAAKAGKTPPAPPPPAGGQPAGRQSRAVPSSVPVQLHKVAGTCAGHSICSQSVPGQHASA